MKKREEKSSGHGLIWLDWVLILIVIGAVGGGVWYWRRQSRAAEALVEIAYVLKISGVDDNYATQNGGWEALIPHGAQVTTANATATLGTVVAVDSQPHLEPCVRKGEIVFAERSGVSDLYVTVYGSGLNRVGDGIRICDVRIAAGSVGEFRIGAFYAANVGVISVKRREAE